MPCSALFASLRGRPPGAQFPWETKVPPPRSKPIRAYTATSCPDDTVCPFRVLRTGRSASRNEHLKHTRLATWAPPPESIGDRPECRLPERVQRLGRFRDAQARRGSPVDPCRPVEPEKRIVHASAPRSIWNETAPP